MRRSAIFEHLFLQVALIWPFFIQIYKIFIYILIKYYVKRQQAENKSAVLRLFWTMAGQCRGSPRRSQLASRVTVGGSPNMIDASFQTLAGSIVCRLLKCGAWA